MDKKNIKELLDFIVVSIVLIEERFTSISHAGAFLENNENISILDAASMRLQTIGEALKSIYKRDASILLDDKRRNVGRLS